jgi:hypothetical protein
LGLEIYGQGWKLLEPRAKVLRRGGHALQAYAMGWLEEGGVKPSQENGTKNRVALKRKNSNDFAVIHSKSFDFPIHCNNLIEVDLQKLEHGFSGGPVFQEGTCVGMLQNGAEENLTYGKIMFGSILTAESIAMRYVKLKGS